MANGELLRCAQCKRAWFCNRQCQVVAVKKQGHIGANCRPVDGVQRPASTAAHYLSAPRQDSTDARHFDNLIYLASKAYSTASRVSYLVAVDLLKEALSVAELIGGGYGAFCRHHAALQLSNSLARLGDMAASARAVCSSIRAARAAGSRTALTASLTVCGTVARNAPNEMAMAERESRGQERLSGPPPSYGSLDLSQEGRISLPTTPAALSRLGLAYNEAAVALCDTALEAVGGRDRPVADDEQRVPDLHTEAQARGCLGAYLYHLGEEQQRSLELLRQAVALLRQAARTAASGGDTLALKRSLASWLSNLGSILWGGKNAPVSYDMAEAEAYLREALELSEETDDVNLKQAVLINLANMSCQPDRPVGPTEAAALRSRLNTLYAQNGRSPDTSCTICLEPLESLEQPGGGADEGAVGDGGRGGDDSSVQVLGCGHQFHHGCISTWRQTTSNTACPICKK